MVSQIDELLRQLINNDSSSCPDFYLQSFFHAFLDLSAANDQG